MHCVVLPALGEEIEKATVACWFFKVGDQVKAEDDIVELVTDKASFNVSPGKGGMIVNILAQEGQDVKIGATLAVIEPIE